MLSILWGKAQENQANAIEAIYNSSRNLTINRYKINEDYPYLKLSSDFSQENVQHIPYTDQRIKKIDLVYTTFRESPLFDQKQLNLARIKNLIEINPQIASNTFFEWNLIEQTGCSSSITCKQFYHGFVIYYEKYFTRKETTREIDSIRRDLSELEVTIQQNQTLLDVNKRPIACEYPELLYSEEYIAEKLKDYFGCSEKYTGLAHFIADIDYKGRVTDVRVKGSLVPCKSELERALEQLLQWKRGQIIGLKQYNLQANGRIQYPIRKNSLDITGYTLPEALVSGYQIYSQGLRCLAYQTDTSYTKLLPKIIQKEVSTVLFRNQWTDHLFIVDVTGSMFPYTADLLRWMRLNNADYQEKTFVFFNDGDDKPTSEKVIGQTGGIYLVRTAQFQEVKSKMFETMRKGGGGDPMENNFEALLYGIKKSGFPNSAVMIADNLSFPRDHQLLANYKGQLKIILCGTEKGVNTDYLDLARKYRFSLHTLHSDISNLHEISVGRRIKIDGNTYLLTSSGFENTSPLR